MPISILAARSCEKFRVRAQAAVARLHMIAIKPMLFLRLQRSTRMETGKVKMTIDQ